MFTRRPTYKLIRPSARPPVQPDEPKPLYEPLREEDEEPLTQRLYELDRSSAQFPERLDELLQDEGWVKDIQRLSQRKLVELIDYLDNVRLTSMPSKSCSSSLQILDGLDRTCSHFREGLCVLRELCSSRETLPTTYLLSGKLSDGYRNIYDGSLGDVDFYIKRPWMLPGEQPEGVERVSHPHTL